jgi:mRNA interferase RelE/StbE
MASDQQERYTVLLERQAEKSLQRLPREVLGRVDRLILALAGDPRPAGCKKLKRYESLHRVRVGDWRIVYAVEDDQLIVLVIEIAPRGQACRDL